MTAGIDPHKSSHTASAVDPATNTVVASLRVHADPAGYRELLRRGRRFGDRCCAIENANGPGRYLAQWLLARDERLADHARRRKIRPSDHSHPGPSSLTNTEAPRTLGGPGVSRAWRSWDARVGGD